MRSSNPIFSRLENNHYVSDTAYASKSGVVKKTSLLIAIALVTGFLSIYIPVNVLSVIILPIIIATFIFSIISIFTTRFAPLFSILYAAGQGLIYGILTYILNSVYPGVGMIALTGTLSVFLVMFTLYSTGILRASSFLRKLVLGSLIAIVFGSLIISVTSLVNPNFASVFAGNYSLLIAIYIGLIIVGAFMLVLDFDRAERIIGMGLSKREEWVASLGIMITLVWIYVNILRLVVTIAARNSRN